MRARFEFGVLWLDGCECPSGVNECELALSGEEPVVSVYARYDPARILLAGSGNGEVTWPGGSCVGVPSGGPSQCTTDDLPARVPIVFSADPTDPHDSIKWAFGCEPVPTTAASASPCRRTDSVAVSFDGVDPDPPFNVKAWLRVGNIGGGSGTITGSHGFNCGSGDDCRKLLDFGKVVTLHAERDADSRFVGWVGVCGSNPSCTFHAGPVTSVQARFAAVAPPPPPPIPPPPPPPSPPPPRKLEVRVIKLTSMRKAGRWRVTARVRVNKPALVRGRVGRQRRTWGNRAINLRAGHPLADDPARQAGDKGQVLVPPHGADARRQDAYASRRTVKLGR